MLVRRISTLVFTIVLVSVTIMPSAEEDPSLDNPDLNQEDSDRFDADGDGTLSQEEKEIMFEAMALEVFTGQKLSRQDLRGMRRGRGGRPGGMGPNRAEQKLTQKFDVDQNGFLDSAERQEALKAVQSRERQGGPPGGRGRRVQAQVGTPGPKVSSRDVKNYPKAGLYDPAVLRTVFIEFDTETWKEEMAKFKNTDIEMPATLTIDGRKYPMVGVKFRGQSSFGHVPAESKRSLNLSMDFIDRDQRLYGYKTINLLNCNGDASFLSSILYSHLAADYLPVPKANIMKVVINGESWGLYSNVQQYNKDFLQEFYGTTAGARWKVPGSPRADGGLRYLGEDRDLYRQRFEIKSKDDKDSWQALINLCQVLNETPAKDLPRAIEPILNVDQVLRFLAIDVAVVNSDGYWTRASDYSIYLQPSGLFHIIPHDMNEAFRDGRRPRGGSPHPAEGAIDVDKDGVLTVEEFGSTDGGPLPPGGIFGRTGSPGSGRGHGDSTLDPLVGLDSDRMPLRSKLLTVPQYRKRYLQYLRTIAEKSLKNLSPVIAHYRQLMDDEMKIDTRKTSSYDAFAHATAPWQENGAPAPGSLNDFIGKRRDFLLTHAEIKNIDAIDVERPAVPNLGRPKGNDKITVAISEFLASNKRTNKDPQGEFEDWIELFNYGNTEIDLSGVCLTDDLDNLSKWEIPSGTLIQAGGYLVIWADEDGGSAGLHANFKLSKGGESIILSNSDVVVDKVEFGPQMPDLSSGRISGHTGKIEKLDPSPSAANRGID